jgi:hypothetical protein
MIKVVFLATSVVEAVNGKTFEEGKAYWLRPDQYAFWDARGRIALAPADMKTENAPFSVMRAGRNTFDVVGPSNRRLNTTALPWAEAEALRVKSESEWLTGAKTKEAPPVAPAALASVPALVAEDPFAEDEPAQEPALVVEKTQHSPRHAQHGHTFRSGKRK